MPYEIHRNAERGHIDHGWLKSAHSFSFANYYNPKRMNFGSLLVINEDTIQPKGGFGDHSHDNMGIVTIPLSGSLRHQDSLGNGSTVQAGDVQIMSAGTGIIHREVNPSATESVHLLQIWITPKEQGIQTRYDQKTFAPELFFGKFQLIIGPTVSVDQLYIHQDAYFQTGLFEAGASFELKQHQRSHGTFLFVILGKIQIKGETLSAGDAYAMWDEEGMEGKVLELAQLLAIEVPMDERLP